MLFHNFIYNSLVAGGLSVVLIFSHYLSPYLKTIPWLDPKRIISFAGGVAVGYVFLHMLPDIVETRDRIHELLEKVTFMSPFKDLITFTIALLGFEVFYLLERYTMQINVSTALNKTHAYIINMGMYFIYNFLITYTLFVRVETGTMYAVLFTIAISLHFVLSDNHFKRYYPERFTLRARLILVSALFIGYLLSIVLPDNIYFSAMLTAFLSGAILYNAFSEEIALNRQTSMGFFFLGTFLMAALLGFLLIH